MRAAWIVFAAVAAAVVLSVQDITAQRNAGRRSYATGQEVVPAYEGWEQNDDGSFNLVFGTMNRNWEEELHIPIGPHNSIEPGGPDQGQPTYFLPRRNRFLFRIRVPADFGENELVWTLTSPNGETKHAYGTLKPDYYMDNNVRMANNGAGVRGDLYKNAPPELTLDGPLRRTVKVNEPVVLTAVAQDDGLPEARPMRPTDPARPASLAPVAAQGLRLSWFVYRGQHRRGLRPGADQGVGGHAGELELAVGRRLGDAAAAQGQQVGGAGEVRRARHLRAALHRPRRRPLELRGRHLRGHRLGVVSAPLGVCAAGGADPRPRLLPRSDAAGRPPGWLAARRFPAARC